MNIVRLHAVALPVLLMLISASSGDLVGYTATWTGNSVVYRTNVDTGEQTPLGPSGMSYITALEISPIDGSLYGSNGQGFWKIDPQTGLGSRLAAGGNNSLAYDGAGQRLYGATYSEIFEIDTETGQRQLIGSTAPFITNRSLAIGNDGTAIAWDAGSDWLFQIDLSDGSTTALGYLDGDFDAFDFGPDGTLYAWAYRELYEIDPVNLTANSVRSFPIGGYSFAIAGEPGPLPILGDMNDDGSVDGLDVDPFVNAVIFEPFNLRGDMNEDGSVTGLDVARFVNALTTGGAQAVPEPSTLALATIVLLVLASTWHRWGGWAVGRHT